MSVTTNPNQLARIAECYSPDSFTSPGARFLEEIADSVNERREDGSLVRVDAPAEIADAAVPVYTHERWQTFVDLGAYEEDVSELGADASDLTQCAAVALYMIAERLAGALIEQDDEDDAA